MNPSQAHFERLIRGLSSDEIISAAIECGLIENRNFKRGDEVLVPHWLAEILSKKGITEIVID